MAAKKKTKTQSKAQETTLRHLWLAGLGAIAVARRETSNAANGAVAKVESLKQQAGKLANDTQANVRGSIASVREQGEAKASQFSADVEARLAPVLVKLGLKPKAKKASRGRKPTKKATAAKRTTRATPARKKPVAKRTVRKTRA
ncbi:MAG: phasin family protein [Pseudoxanthomonas sp.]